MKSFMDGILSVILWTIIFSVFENFSNSNGGAGKLKFIQEQIKFHLEIASYITTFLENLMLFYIHELKRFLHLLIKAA